MAEVNDVTAAAVGLRLRRIRALTHQSLTDFTKSVDLCSFYENGSRMCSLDAACTIAKSWAASLGYIFSVTSAA